MKYLILGSNSFAGASLTNYLLLQAHAVIGVSRSPEPSPFLLAYANNKNIKLFTFYQYDINKHFHELVALINREKPQFIVDFAGQGMVAESWKSPEQWYQTNFVAKVRLHNYLRQCDFLEKYVRVSTPEVYGNTDHAVDETQIFNPSTPYAVSHAAIDMSLKAFHEQYQFPVILTRFANFYGPHQQLYRIIPRTILYCLLGKKLQLHGGGKSERAFIYGDDVASAIDCAIQKGRCGETYHFSTGDVISIKNLVEKICDTMQVDFNSFVEITSDRPGKDALYSMKTDKAEKELSWKPSVALDQGIQNTIYWLQAHTAKIKKLSLEYVHQV
ncbi:MAG: dTDP-glucose 4,6-dehydratase [Gammaproteobacteria bacterium CG_4_10_14_0_8_um_filter_38_16]|nr:MAG: dTDP-glucose 4,6-dehydratase [Gammaproteobacteria bacterium CG_4_10_14_0_8_um_filter_38_16]PJA04113.1 MAG: dTDP-glucose 4,6-dehydratase [Gammaproteobacteria bacterium CG_4_10_14_0_2_um_filter_38_22]PJB10021.1 MAG: dTDP-glucose 4,6-dehydratase [Gammaproteobacteria bacterium CG_4_9_14_3_um_filter_38_9]